MKKSLFTPFIFAAILQWTCSNSPLGLGKDGSRDWVAMTARIKEYRQIVLVDFNNPSKYKILTDNEHQNIAPKFSNDRTKIIYQDRRTGSAHDPQLILYHLRDGKTQPLVLDKMLTEETKYPLTGEGVIWDPFDSAIYYRVSDGPFGAGEDILYYGFDSKMENRFTNTGGYSEWPEGFKGSDTLIVFSDDTMSTKQPPGFFYMDLSGRYLDRINNPHFEFIKRNELFYKKAAWEPDWSEELELFVYSQQDTTFRGGKITITNIDGSYYKMYTSGEYADHRPVWGPDTKTILFERNDFPTGNPRVMILDLETGKVIQFVRPKEIRGATDLSFPDY